MWSTRVNSANIRIEQLRTILMSNFKKSLSGKKVLVVDDTELNIFSLKMLFKTYDISIIGVNNAPDALQHLNNPDHDIDIILMDIRMPNMNGFEAIQEIHKIECRTNTPIIAVTAQAMVGDREKCLEAGADEYVTKPIDTNELFQKMANLL